MFKKLIIWMISVIIIFNIVILSTPAQATPLYNPTSSVNLDSISSESPKELVFSDDPNFYSELTKLLQSKERIVIKTKFRNYDEFPSSLKRIFQPEMPSAAYASYEGPEGVEAKINFNVLVLFGTTSAGAIAGATLGAFVAGIGAPIGGLLGGGLGLIAGAVGVALSDNCHEVKFILTPPYGIVIDIIPKC